MKTKKEKWLKPFIEVDKIPVGQEFVIVELAGPDAVKYKKLAWKAGEEPVLDITNIIAVNEDNVLVWFQKNQLVRPIDPNTDTWINTPEEDAELKSSTDRSDLVMCQMQKMVEDALEAVKVPDRDRYVYYSAYDHTSDDVPINNLNEIAVVGKALFLEDEAAAYDQGEKYLSKVVENPTWLDICVLANEMILTTGDTHHIFLEGVKKIKGNPPHNPPIYRFLMGS